MSACLKGELSVWLSRGLPEKAEEAAREYAALFAPGDYYVELMDHGLPEQKAVNPQLVAIARKLGLPLVATNDIHFARREDAESQDVLVCIQTNRKISDPDRLKFSTDQFYFKSAAEMAAIFRDTPDAIENTGKIASRCDFEFPAKSYHLPQFTPPEGKTLSEYFEEVAWAGFQTRLAQREAKGANGGAAHTQAEYEERMEREIELIKKMGFEGYFLIVWDLLKTAREKGIPVGPGRGSAAGSLLAHSLEITEIDPIEYDLLFERFLNPERISLPDIDMDFCGRRRQEMIEYVTRKYGQENVCQIITFGTMAARGAIRDVGRVLEVPLPEVDRIAKMIPLALDATIADALKTVPELRALRDRNSKVAQLLAIAQKIEGQVRHPSIHAAGIVITPKPLVEFLPLYQSVKGEITTQFPMGDVEALGLLKMDLLGLRNLTVIDDALELLRQQTGETIDINNLPLDDDATFELFRAGNTDGIFQFESPGMKDLLRRFRPTEFRDLIALNALYRPGPLKSGMTDESIHRRNHPERVAYELPELEPILRETRGIIIYQEQVMRIATDLAGFTLAGADLLRKAMGKKDKETMKAQKQKFVQGAKKKGIASSKADKIFEQIKEFAEYGFNKSHSAAYAFLAYQTAWLKVHYPVHFLAALLTSEAERGATPQVVKYIGECHEMGIQVLPPDINTSEFRFAVEGKDIRFGLAAVKGIGQAAVEELVAARKRAGGFRSPFDLFLEHDTKVAQPQGRREPDQGRRVRFAGLEAVAVLPHARPDDRLRPRRPEGRGHPPELPLRLGRGRAAARPPGGPGDAGVGRVPRPLLRDGRPRPLHHRPPPGPAQGPPAQARLAPHQRARLGAGLRQGRPPGRHHRLLQAPQDEEGRAHGHVRPRGPDRQDRGGRVPRLLRPPRPVPARRPARLDQGQVHGRGGEPPHQPEPGHAPGRGLREAGQARRRPHLPARPRGGHDRRAQDRPRRLRGPLPGPVRTGDAPLLPRPDPERRGPEGDALGGPGPEDRVAARGKLGDGRVLSPSLRLCSGISSSSPAPGTSARGSPRCAGPPSTTGICEDNPLTASRGDYRIHRKHQSQLD